MNQENNFAEFEGVLKENFSFSHEKYGEKFYENYLRVKRDSGYEDVIPIIIPEILIKNYKKDSWVLISGDIRTFKRSDKTTMLFVFVKEMDSPQNGFYYKNKVSLNGLVRKDIVFRHTPLKREIAQISLLVEGRYGKKTFIPCISWGRMAIFSSYLKERTGLKIEGRFQSREYKKKIKEEEYETRTAYEISISKLEVIESEEREDQVADAE